MTKQVKKTIDTLVEDIYALFESDDPHYVTDENAEALGTAIADVIKQRFSVGKRENYLRLSQIGSSDCKSYYSCNNYEGEKLKGWTLIKFLYGDILEELLLFLAKEAGHTVTDMQREVEIEGVKGHIDCKIDGVLVDVKSAATFSFQKFDNGTLSPQNDSFGYIDQLSAYATAMGEDRAAIFAIDKQHGHITVCKVDDHLYNATPRVKYLKELVASPIPPACDCVVEEDGKSGNMKLAVPTSYSAYKKHCFPNARTFLYSGGPRYLVRVEREPASHVVEINWDGDVVGGYVEDKFEVIDD
jgi:hypothetical protein